MKACGVRSVRSSCEWMAARHQYMAIRLSKAFGSTPETWLGMQMAYDLWQTHDRVAQITVEPFEVA